MEVSPGSRRLRLDKPPGLAQEQAVSETTAILIASLGVLFIGISKAGLGGGLGMLTTPLCVLAFSASGKPTPFVIGMLLPLLCAGDAFSLYHYWGKWNRATLKFLMPGVVVGVIVGVQLIGVLSPRQLNIAIGTLAVLFVVFQFVKERIFRAEGTFAASHAVGVPCGIAAGVTSAVAHGAGPLVAVYLIPQKLPKETYMSTHVLIFTLINWIKMPFYVANDLINKETLTTDAYYLPLIPLGVWIGLWLNRRFSEKLFLQLVYGFTLATGLQLIFNFDLVGWLR